MGTVTLHTRFRDSRGTSRTAPHHFYVMDMPAQDIILGHPWLDDVNPLVDWRARTLCFRYEKEDLEVLNTEEFHTAAEESGG